MRAEFSKLILVTISLITVLVPAWATEISDYKIKDEAKKVKLSFVLSDEFEYSTVSDFNSNILILQFEDLDLSRNQKAKDHRLKGDSEFKVLRFVRFQDSGEHAEIRIYLGWNVNPADAQVIGFDDHIEVDILKPYGIAVTATPEAGGEFIIERGEEQPESDGADAQPETSPDTTEGETTPANDGLALGSLRDGNLSVPEPGVDTADPGTEPVAPAVVESSVNVEDTSGDPSTDFRPSREFNSTPSYKKFDLDEVEVKQLEFRGIPFNLALLDLVAGTGFNVVIGDEIDDKPVTLNFTKKEMSLKGALYILCTAYDLKYTVEDDAIIIRGK